MLIIVNAKDTKWEAKQAEEEHSRMQVLSIFTDTLAEDHTEVIEVQIDQ